MSRNACASVCSCAGASATPRCRPTYQSRNSASSRASSASSYGGSAPSRVAVCQRISAIARVGVECRRGLRVEFREVGPGAEIGEQQEAASGIPRQHFGRVQACVREQSSHVDEGTAVLHRRRRVHDDQRRMPLPRRLGRDPEVAAEARVGGGGREGERAGAKRGRGPGAELVAADVGGVRGCGHWADSPRTRSLAGAVASRVH